MHTNIILFKPRRGANPRATARDTAPSIYGIVEAIIDRRRLAATRRMTRQQLQNLPSIVRRDVGMADVPPIKNNELTYQFYSLD